MALLVVFLVCKALVLAGRQVELTPLALAAYAWQDCLVVLIFAALELLLGKRPGWFMYISAALWAAINVPVARMMSTPLTWPMIGAAGGTLSDSIMHQVTAANIICMSIVTVVAVIAPIFIKRVSWKILAPVAAIAIIGSLSANRIDTLGRHRNPFVVLVTSAFPRVEARQSEQDWRQSPFGQSPAKPLLELSATARGKNIVIVILESTGSQYLKPYGAAEDPMPTLTDLSSRALIFENAYTTYPESIKGLMATLCSRYPAIDTAAEQYASVQTPSIADVLRARGYRTGLFHSGRFMYLGMREVIQNRGFDTLEDAGHIGGNHNSSFGIDEPSAVQRVLQWIDNGPKNQPFLAVYMPIAGHHPYETTTAGPFPEKEEIDRYRSALHEGDQALAQLITGLKSRNLFDQTILIFFGDHGEAFGQHDGNFGHTNFVYEENVRVPLIIVSPTITTQLRVNRPVSLIDVPPTILDLLGQEQPSQWQGTSALAATGMPLFFTDYSLGLLGLRDANYKFIYELESRRMKLFDLSNDPHEQHDLSAREKSRCEKYRDHLLNWSAAQRDLVLRGV
jgi:phosphoglycerol transferase MdoB-like AlkP superfamily enzyme